MADRVHSPVSSPVTSAFPKFPVGRLNHKIPLNDFRAGGISQLQSFDNLQASEFAATQVVPTADYPLRMPERLWRLRPSTARFVTSPRIGYA